MNFYEWLETQEYNPVFIACSDDVEEAARLGWLAGRKDLCEMFERIYVKAGLIDKEKDDE